MSDVLFWIGCGIPYLVVGVLVTGIALRAKFTDHDRQMDPFLWFVAVAWPFLLLVVSGSFLNWCVKKIGGLRDDSRP